MSLEQDIDVFSGNDTLLRVTVTDADTGAALDLTGAQELVWALAKKVNAPTALVTKNLANGVVITDHVNGVVEVAVGAADLEPLKGPYYHELRLTNSDGKKVTLLFGVVTVQDNLIRT